MDSQQRGHARGNFSKVRIVLAATYLLMLLVDGGLVRNLPVDVALDMGADVIIAVDVGLPLLEKNAITSFFCPQSVWIALLRSPLFDRVDLSRLEKLRAIFRILTGELDDPQAAFETLRQMLQLAPDEEHNHVHRNGAGEIHVVFIQPIGNGG